jgi:hypothetical protein
MRGQIEYILSRVLLQGSVASAHWLEKEIREKKEDAHLVINEESQASWWSRPRHEQIRQGEQE